VPFDRFLPRLDRRFVRLIAFAFAIGALHLLPMGVLPMGFPQPQAAAMQDRPLSADGARGAGQRDSSGPLDEAALEDLRRPAEGTTPPPKPTGPAQIVLLDLLLKGGWFMIPIGIVSVIALTVCIERLLNLRAGRIIPQPLARDLSRDGRESSALGMEQGLVACARHPSSLAAVVRNMLMRSGRPLPEVEHAATEATQREMDRVGGPIRWLHLTAAVAPLLGLLGTVWGMIVCFHDTTRIPPGQNKAEYLAEGIYIALVTTLAGLIVAIPAAMAAHYFEGRMLRLFRRLEEFVFELAPAIARSDRPAPMPPPPPPPAAERRARPSGQPISP
jgi:biopolymer transport protein ExbB